MVTQTQEAPTTTAADIRTDKQAAPKSAYQERQGMAMAWLWSTMLLFFLLAGLALGAALVFKVGFFGWLITIGLMGGIIVATVVAITSYVLKPER